MSDNGPEIKKIASRKRGAANEPSEMIRLAKEHGVTPVQAKNLLARFGKDRVNLDAAAQRLKFPSH